MVAPNELIHRAAAGDESAIEELYRSSWRSLYETIYHQLRDSHEAEDVTQETFVRAIRVLPSFRGGCFASYLKVIATNILRDRWRTKRSRTIHVPLDDSDISVQDPADGVVTRHLVRSALERLAPEYQRVIELRIMQRRTTAETAAIMMRTESAITSLLYRAMREFKELIR